MSEPGEGGEQQQPAGTQGLGWLACDSDQVHQVDQDALGLTPLDQFPIACQHLVSITAVSADPARHRPGGSDQETGMFFFGKVKRGSIPLQRAEGSEVSVTDQQMAVYIHQVPRAPPSFSRSSTPCAVANRGRMWSPTSGSMRAGLLERNGLGWSITGLR